MILEKVDKERYEEIMPEPYHVFGAASFNELNKDKVGELHYLLFKDTKYRLGIIGGQSDGVFKSPFSAPFGGFIFISHDISLIEIENATDCLLTWARDNNIKQINITLPPFIYANSYLSKIANVFFRKKIIDTQIDLNYHFLLSSFTDNYIKDIWRNARKNLAKALANNLSFIICSDEVDKKDAYEVIKKNRESRGFPLRMTWDQIFKTTAVILADFFLVKTEGNISIAAAIVFRVSETIVQVIYWGDIPDYAHLKTMNYLSFKVFEFYKSQNINVVDIGPSTENSIPNYGLCEFKEGIGCEISTKLSYTIKLANDI